MTEKNETRIARAIVITFTIIAVCVLAVIFVNAQTPGNNGAAMLKWTNGGDYDTLGVASIPYARVIIKMSRDTITQANYLLRPEYLQTHFPTGPQQPDSLLLTGLTDNRNWFFTVLGVDSAGNVSAYFPAVRKRSTDGTAPAPIQGWR